MPACCHYACGARYMFVVLTVLHFMKKQKNVFEVTDLVANTSVPSFATKGAVLLKLPTKYL